MVDNIRNNTISEISTKKSLNTLNKIKNAEIIKYKNHTPKHKELLNLLNDLLDVILTGKTLELESQEDKNKNENEIVESRKEENENENKDDDVDDDDETMSQNEKNETIKVKNDILDEIINKSKSFEEQMKLFKKIKCVKAYQHSIDYGDKELKFKYFKIELADMSNEIDKKLFEQIFSHTLETLAHKLINTTNKKENQIIVKDINENNEKLNEMDPFHNFVIQPSD